jgi:long-chain acyl-CoA synthetase
MSHTETAMDDLKRLPLPQQLLYWARSRPDKMALRQKQFGIWQPVTWAQYAEQARHFGLGLLQLGVLPGQPVAILSENRKEWLYAELGAAMVRAVTAGIYPTSPASEVEYLLALSETPVVVLEDQEQLDKVLSVRAQLPHLRAIVIMDTRGLRRYDREGLHDFADVLALGQRFEAGQPLAAAAACEGPQLDDIGLMVFTSGSTGRPKAAMMSWRGLGTAARGLDTALQLTDRDQTVSYLPLCHVAEQMFSLHVPLAKGAVVNFAESLRTIQEDLREVAPQVFFGVPRIWEKFHASIETKMRETGGLRAWLFRRGMQRMQAISPARAAGLLGKLERGFWYVMVMRAVQNFIGMRDCRVAFSAGAPITPEILKFFRCLGVSVRELYGLTESSGALTLQMSDRSPVGSVGVAYPGIELKLAEDGEILVHGDVVFRGYFKNEEATREAIDAEGWLHTGDVGTWGEGPDGPELRVIDRKKDIMITAGGKNITPSEIENGLRFSAFVKEAVVVADRRRFVSALIQINFESVSQWAEAKGLTYTHFRSLVELPDVRDLIQAEVDLVNGHMPQVQQVRKFHLLTKELDHDDGEVTATMKVKRKSIYEKYADAIEAMYA